MDVDLIFKIAGLGILVAIIHTLLDKFGKEEYAYIVTLVGLVFAFGTVVNLVSKLFDNLKILFRL
ncbi:stage III sporulation protein AC [Tissierella sp. MB52-C2]|uniref:stage III sporulation protein AC n=1 Tax=Tissierella sp. MB52-C2 TaxID=3070999 RepID=UPI00280B89A4|nr:stage III sporulation protein AC [Tissierella sp. MB52-C2]WMM26924.1 stage III sporulation protein AC [Tissierella sp. MB52-C2]